MPIGKLHHDAPLTNFAVQAFSASQDYIAPQVVPTIPVAKQSDKYYVLDRDSWLMMPASTVRAPKAPPRRVDWKVASESYYAINYALANELSKEDLSNADTALDLRMRSAEFTTEMLLRDYEQRVATLFTNTANFNASVALTAANAWDAVSSADIQSQVTSGHARIRQQTGLTANTLILDYDSYRLAKLNRRLAGTFAYTTIPAELSDAQVAQALGVDNIFVGKAIKNTAGLTAGTSVFSSQNVWGRSAVLCRMAPANTLKAATFAAAFRWQPDGVPAPMQAYRYDDPDPGKKVEVVEVGYYQTEKIIAADLGYLMITG